jgi:outer membrane receptor protein involved in Fe transport
LLALLISNITSANLNLAFTKTDGGDLEVGYRFPLSRMFSRAGGDLSLRLLGTHIGSLDTNNGIITVDRTGESGNAKWRITGSGMYVSGPLSVYLQGRYIQSAKIDNTYGPNDIYDNNLPSFFYMDGSVQYTLREAGDGTKVQLFANINNLFDKDPPIVPSASAAAGQVLLAPDYQDRALLHAGLAAQVLRRYSYGGKDRETLPQCLDCSDRLRRRVGFGASLVRRLRPNQDCRYPGNFEGIQVHQSA